MFISLASFASATPALAVVPTENTLCNGAIATAEPTAQLPPHLLSAIAIVESGRAVPGAGMRAPWPWTINVNGTGRVFDSKAEAIAAVQDAQKAGSLSIDVGCMQINLFYHPQAFATLDEAFDPAANVAYAVRFLTALHRQTRDWGSATAAYHSATPELGAAYAQRVEKLWPDSAQFGVSLAAPTLALSAGLLEAQVDPNHALTPAFRSERIAAAVRQRQQAASRAATPARTQSQASALVDDVDPHRTLTPAFRAQMVAAAAIRHQHELDAGAQRGADARSISGRARRPGSKLFAASVVAPASRP